MRVQKTNHFSTTWEKGLKLRSMARRENSFPECQKRRFAVKIEMTVNKQVLPAKLEFKISARISRKTRRGSQQAFSLRHISEKILNSCH